MRLVLDASALAGWLMPDEDSSDLGRRLAAAEEILAPWLLWAEIRNIVIVGERRGRLPPGLADEVVEAVDGLGIALDTSPSGAAVLALARRHGLSVHDALYLELALRRGACLASRDRALVAAAEAERVSLV